MEARSFNLKARLSATRKALVPVISATELGRRLVQSGLADFKPAQVSTLELGYRYATWTEVEALAGALNVDPYWLANRPRPALAVPREHDIADQTKAMKPKAKSGRVGFVIRPAVAAAVPVPVSPPAPSEEALPPDLAPAELPVLVPGAEAEHQRRLVSELSRTMAKLGDEKLKPFEWRSWREYEKRIRAAAAGLVALPD